MKQSNGKKKWERKYSERNRCNKKCEKSIKENSVEKESAREESLIQSKYLN